MSTQPTPGALSAAFAVRHGPEHVAFYMHRHEIEGAGSEDLAAAESIDRLAVKPATAELLAALQTVVQNLKFMRAQFGRSLITMDSQAIDIGIDRAESVIASYTGDSRQHEART